MATLHLMVGLPCSGKTTRARELERDLPALRLTTDEWHLRLYGQDAEDPAHDDRHRDLEALLWQVAERALELGNDVVLDFGLWAREEREEFRARAARLGVGSEIHFLDAAPDELLRRLRARNEAPSAFDFVITEDMMTPWIASFEAPTPEELRRRRPR